MEINQLKALIRIGYTKSNGLVICESNLQKFPIAERYHIEYKAKKLGVSAVLFRRYFDDNNNIINSKPSVYIFEEEKAFEKQTPTQLHAKLWSAGEIEVYIIVGQTEIKIINARRPTEIKDNNLSLENLVLASEPLVKFNDYRFSAHIFGKGMFWEQGDFNEENQPNFYNNQLKEENSPFLQLLDYLLKTRKYLHEKLKSLPNETIDKLLIICLLIKFLEEIKDDDGRHTLKDIYKNLGIRNLQDSFSVNGNDTFLSILKSLSQEFNGQIFSVLDEQKKQISQANLSLLVHFLNADLDIAKQQFFLWKQYSFNHLPIELISSIYENFLPKQKGVVYTPPFLVNFLIDEVMPLHKPQLENETFKVLDPSCGSGIFLVAAYKRLLQWWTVNHYRKTQQIVFPDKTVCQRLLEQNIFGVDIEPTATLISIFSLTITLLDKLSPKEIWNGLKFNDLQNNIQTQNFFDWACTAPKDFDLVIGNPPFNFEEGKKLEDYIYKKDENGTVIKDFTDKNHITFRHPKLPNNNFPLHFFEGAMALGKKTCLIIPSNVLLYNYNTIAQSYRTQIFTDFTVHKIFDFTHLQGVLFHASVAVCAIFAENQPSKQEPTEHTIIHRIVSVEKKLAFQPDHYDRHLVRWEVATNKNKQFVWKTNLLGGGRLFNLVDRLSMLETLNDFIKEKKKNSNWQYNIGYIVGNDAQNNKADFITGQDSILNMEPNKQPEVYIETSQTFEATRKSDLYRPPFILIWQKSNEEGIPIFLVKEYKKEYLCFKRIFIGISSPKSDIDILEHLYDKLSKKYLSLYQLWILCVSASTMMLKATAINKEDIDSLPFPENEEYLQLSETEKIIQDDVLNYYRYLRSGIKIGKGKIFNQKVTSTQLEEFGKVFCTTINEEHDHQEENRAWQIGDVLETDNFIAYQFIFGTTQSQNAFNIRQTDWQNLNNLVFNTQENTSAIFVRVVRYYGSTEQYDFVWLIKPNTMRYWLSSIALRDADDTFIDYFEIGY